jgi:hypothetical protein
MDDLLKSYTYRNYACEHRENTMVGFVYVGSPTTIQEALANGQKGLPFLYSTESEANLRKQIDFVMATPDSERFKDLKEWNDLLREKGLKK